MSIDTLQKDNTALKAKLSEARGRLPRADVPNPDSFLTLAEAGELLGLTEIQVQGFVSGKVNIETDGKGRDIIPKADLDTLLTTIHVGQTPLRAILQSQGRMKNTL